MKLNGKKIAAILVALVIVVVAAVIGLKGCSGSNPGPGSSSGQNSNTSTPAGDVTGKTTYTVQVESAGGMPMADVGVYVYTDATKAELIWFDQTDEFGMMSFDEVPGDGYVAVLQDIPVGYALEESYPITGEVTLITLSGALTPYEEAGEFTYTLGSMLYDFTVTTPDGTEYNFAELLGEKKLIVLNFWYSTCAPCKSEFPAIQAVSEGYAEDAIVLCLNPVDGTDEAIKAIMEELELTLPMAGCDAAWADMLAMTAYPTTVIVDRYGMISMMHTGAVTNPEVWELIFSHYTSDEYQQAVYENISLLAEGLDLEGELEEGSEENPVELGGEKNFEVTIPGEGLVYYDLYKVFDMILTVKGDENTYLVYNDKTYKADSNGKISLTVNCADPFTPAKVAFGNSGKEEITVSASLSNKGGTINSPYAMSIGEFTTNVAAGNDQGVYYTWTAPDSGVLTLQNVSCTSGVEYSYVLYNLNSYAQRNMGEDAVTDENGVVTLPISVNKGDTVQVIVGVVPDKSYNYPAATIKTLASFAAGENPDTLYPYVITVVDDDEMPVAGIILSAGGFTYTTDGEGKATVQLKKGEQTVTYTVPDGYYSDVLEQVFEVKGAEEEDAGTLTLKKLRSYTVTVVDDQDNVLPGASVTIGEHTSVADENGVASFRLVKDVYLYEVLLEGYQTKAATVFNENYAAEAVMTAAYVLYSHTVVDESGAPVAGAVLTVEQQDVVLSAGTAVTLPALSVTSDAEGKISYNTYLVDHPATLEVDGYYPMGEVEITNRTMTFTALAADSFTVTVADANGNKIEGVSVTVTETSGLTDFVLTAASDANGVITFTAPANGTYVARVDVSTLPEGYAFTSEDLAFTGNALSIELYSSSSYSVQVLDQDGNPVPGASVSFTGTLAGEDASATYTTDASGKVYFVGDETEETCVTITLPEGYVLAEGETATKYFGTGTSIVYDLTYNLQQMTNYVIALVDYAGNPFTGSGVTVTFNGETVTLTDGRYTVSKESGSYAVTLSGGTQYVLSAASATLTPDQATLTVKVAKAEADGSVYYSFKTEEDGGDVPVYSVGSYAVTVTPGVENYFAIDMSNEKNADGIYELRFEGAGVNKVYYRGNNFFKNTDTSSTNAQGVCTNKLYFGIEIFFAIYPDAGTTEGVLTIVYKGEEETAQHLEFTGTHTPAQYTLPSNPTFTAFDITAPENYDLVKDASGFYHLGSEDGALVLVDFNWSVLSLQTLLSTGPLVSYVDGNGDGKYTSAVDIRVDYTNCVNAYIEKAAVYTHADSTTGTYYPLTDDLMEILQEAGAFKGWWNPTSAEYLPHFDEVGEYAQEDGWMSFLFTAQ